MSKSKKMNVAFFTSAARGLAHYVLHLYKPISKYSRPYYVTYKGQKLDDLVENKIKSIYPLVENNSASSILETIKFLKRKKIDIMNIQVSDTVRKMYMYYSALINYARSVGISVCLTIHDVLTIESMSIDPSAIELLYLTGDSYIVGNEEERDKLVYYFNKEKKNIVPVTHGIYDMFDGKKYTKESAKKSLKIKNENVILFFGQIRPNKGLKYLVKALPLVLKKYPDTLLYISTDLHLSTPELNEFLKRIEKEKIAKHIRLVREYVPSCEIEKVFKAADLVVLPYTQIAQSGVLNLAWGFKKPVVVSDIFNEKEIIENNFGKVAKSQDRVSISEAIIEILSMKDKGKSMGSKAYQYREASANWNIAAVDTFKAYKIAISNARKRSFQDAR